MAGLLLTSACANNSYMGIPLAAGLAVPELQNLASRAQAGDKQAQFELGIRYEEGSGLPIDRGRARKLYQLAADDSGGTLWVYSPPAGSGASGRVIPVDSGPKRPGLPEARLRLERLKEAKK